LYACDSFCLTCTYPFGCHQCEEGYYERDGKCLSPPPSPPQPSPPSPTQTTEPPLGSNSPSSSSSSPSLLRRLLLKCGCVWVVDCVVPGDAHKSIKALQIKMSEIENFMAKQKLAFLKRNNRLLHKKTFVC